VQVVHRLVQRSWCSVSVSSLGDVRQSAIFMDIRDDLCRTLCKELPFACENLGKTALGWGSPVFPHTLRPFSAASAF